MGWVLIFLVVRPSAPRNDRLAFTRSTDSLALLPLSRVRRVSASQPAGTSSTAPGLPALLEPIIDLAPDPGHAPGGGLHRRDTPLDGSGSLRLTPDKTHEQPVRRTPTRTGHQT